MPQISAVKLMQRLDAGHVDPLYLFYGDEPYLIHEYISACLERILASAPRDFNYDVFEASSESLPQALSLARTVPMMASHRVVVLHGVQQLRQDELRQLGEYAAQPSETTALMCSSTDSDAKKLPAVFRESVVTIACMRLEGAPLRAWVVKNVKRCGYTITPEAVQEFLQEQQHDLWFLKQELEKLCTYAGDTQPIGVTEVQAVCHAAYSPSIFRLSDAIGSRRIDQALSLTDALLQQGEPPLVVFSMIVRHLRLLWSIRHLARQSRGIPSMAKMLHLPQHVCRQLEAQSRHLSAQRLEQLYTAAIDADVAFKTTSQPARAILEGVILELCTGS